MPVFDVFVYDPWYISVIYNPSGAQAVVIIQHLENGEEETIDAGYAEELC